MKKATPKSDFFIECLEKNPIFLSGNQFEILYLCASHGKVVKNIPNEAPCINGKWVYARILIKKLS